MASFEVFHKGRVALKREPTVTIQKRGTISLSRSAYTALGEPCAVELLYDSSARIIGFRAADPDDGNGALIRSSTGTTSGPYVLTAIAFLKFHGLDAPVSRRWPAYLEADVLCIDLRQPGTVVTSNRARL